MKKKLFKTSILKTSAFAVGAVLFMNSLCLADVSVYENFEFAAYISDKTGAVKESSNSKRTNRNQSPSEPYRAPVVQKGKRDDIEFISYDKTIHWETGSEYYADYSSIDFVAPLGTKWSLYIEGTELCLSVPDDSSSEIEVYKYESSMTSSFSGSGMISKDIASKLSENGEYWVWVTTNVDGFDLEYYDIYLTKDEEGNLHFLKSPIYDYNVNARTKLWTDEKSLNDCLQEQHDIMWNDPEIISKAEELTEGCTNDYERVLKLYQHITCDFYYDYDQINTNYVFQDDILLLLRDRVAVCEGFANLFVGLCRSIGIPATVSFGSSEDFTDTFVSDTLLSNHAWAEVYIDGTWYITDCTWDNNNEYEEGDYKHRSDTLNWYLIPVEVFSFTHKILNADTAHGEERSGDCGDRATFTESRDGELTIYGYGEVELPDGVDDFFTVTFAEDSNITTIGRSCFSDCDLLTKVYLPDSVEIIEMEAFYTCEDLEYVYIPEGVREIGRSAFEWCDELAYVSLPKSITDLKKHAFDNCPRLVLSIPHDLKDTEFNEYDTLPLSVIIRDR
ncbi:MAG: leucine-rich repeat protein [Clostridia bacterium]|nr:leucine-rich repeat protein [Clostridia bacterium]